MKRARGSALAPASFEALARVRRSLREQAAAPTTPRQPPHKPKAPADGAMLFRRAVADVVPLPPANRADTRARDIHERAQFGQGGADRRCLPFRQIAGRDHQPISAIFTQQNKSQPRPHLPKNIRLVHRHPLAA